jgi:hypothetical protein
MYCGTPTRRSQILRAANIPRHPDAGTVARLHVDGGQRNHRAGAGAGAGDRNSIAPTRTGMDTRIEEA